MSVNWREAMGSRYYTPDQALLTRFVSQPVGSVLVALGVLAGLTPNIVTITGLFFMLAGCVVLLSGDAPLNLVCGGLLWQLGFAFDCADGQLARATGKSGLLGGWLDVSCDFIRQVAIALTILISLSTADVDLHWAGLAVFFLLSGQSVYLYTASLMNTTKPPGFETKGKGVGFVRAVLRQVLDTPLFLLVLVLCWPFKMLLMALGFLYGSLLIIRSVGIAGNRLVNHS